MTPVLPAEFADLEPFSDWCLPPRRQRYARRLESSMDEMESFYAPRSPGSSRSWRTWTRLPLDALPDEAARLLELSYSLVNVSFPVEVLAPGPRAGQRGGQRRRRRRARRLIARGSPPWSRPGPR